jgi:outer membrane protein assembly factor BamB
MTGRTTPYGEYMGHLEDIWVVQFNPSGEIMWEKKYGEEEGRNRGYCIREATDKGFVVGGTKNSKCFLMKIDDSGKLLWERTFPVGEYGQGDIYSIVKASDGGYILAGKDYSMHGDFLIIKTDVNGELEWKKSVGGDEQEIAYQVGRTRHGAYIVVGRTRSFGNGWEDIFLVKISESGNILSQTSIGSKDYEIGKSIYCLEDVEHEQTSAELFVILGVRITSSQRYTFMLKTSDQGTLTSFSDLIRMMNPPNQ